MKKTEASENVSTLPAGLIRRSVLFERFLDSTRVSPPDIDTNFERNGIVFLDYVGMARTPSNERTSPFNSTPPASSDSRLTDLLDYMATKRNLYVELGEKIYDDDPHADLSLKDRYFYQANELSEIIHLAFASEAMGNTAEIVCAEIKDYVVTHRNLAELGTPSDLNASLKKCYMEILYKMSLLEMSFS